MISVDDLNGMVALGWLHIVACCRDLHTCGRQLLQ
jgi:hypothetical protein